MLNQDFQDANVVLERTKTDFKELPALTIEEKQTIYNLIDGSGVADALKRLHGEWATHMINKLQADL